MAQSTQTPSSVSGAHQKKRLIVCCDGTWVNSDNGYDDEKRALAVPSNVTRFCRALRPESWREGGQNVPQISYYQAGVGTGHALMDQIGGGAAGEGIDEHIREAYSFVARNWCSGPTKTVDEYQFDAMDDELYLVGFSRGAFTARSIVAFISTVGLLTKRGMDYFPEIFKDYEHMNLPKDKYTNPLTKDGLGDKKPHLGSDKASQKQYRDFLRSQPIPLTSARVPAINAIGVWDTVGSLGVPGIALVDDLKAAMHLPVYRKELQFYDTTLAENVLHAFQALALDESRHPFTPCLWEKPKNTNTKMKQVWFPGVHSNVGGGVKDLDISDITLAWMFSQFDKFLDFDSDYIKQTFEINQKKASARPYACGDILVKDQSHIYNISGHRTRTPGQYHRSDPNTGTETDAYLEHTHERIHPSVRVRLASNALGEFGIDDKGEYLASALTHEDAHIWNEILGQQSILRHGWKLVKNDPKNPVAFENDFAGNQNFPADQKVPSFYWKCLNADDHKSSNYPNFMIEETLGKWEEKLWGLKNPKQNINDPVAKEWLL